MAHAQTCLPIGRTAAHADTSAADRPRTASRVHAAIARRTLLRFAVAFAPTLTTTAPTAVHVATYAHRDFPAQLASATALANETAPGSPALSFHKGIRLWNVSTTFRSCWQHQCRVANRSGGRGPF